MADTKSIRSEATSFGDSLSYGDSASISIGGTSKGSRTEARRQRHLAKLKRRNKENQAQRHLLFRPRVYESWKEGDLDFETAERERLLKDIAAKEQRLQDKRRKREEEGGDADDIHSDSSEEHQVVNQLERLKSRKQREEEYKKKLENDKKRQEEEERLEHEEKLASELQNPTIYGWYYTDGYYDNAPFFGVHENIVAKINEEQDRWREKWSLKYPETFTTMFKRYFWPPKYICKGRSFRTRGSYLDFPEVIADWPKNVEVNFEREPREYITNRHELFGVDEEQKKADEDELAQAEAAAALEEAQEAAAVEEFPMPIPSQPKEKEKVVEEELPKRDPKRPYDRPWATAPKGDDAKSSKSSKLRNNKVGPMTGESNLETGSKKRFPYKPLKQPKWRK